MENDTPGPIYFLGTGHQDLSPFSAHEVEIDGVVFKTAEYAYQALRVIPKAREGVASTRSPILAWQAGQLCKQRNEIMPNYDKEQLREKILRAKLAQHTDVHDMLLATKGRDLVKNSETDYYWGTGKDGSGKNMLGEIWMKLRAELLGNGV